MPKWEYQTITLNREIKSQGLGFAFEWQQSIDLNKLGQEGWELVATIPISNRPKTDIDRGATHELRYIFKRQIS